MSPHKRNLQTRYPVRHAIQAISVITLCIITFVAGWKFRDYTMHRSNRHVTQSQYAVQHSSPVKQTEIKLNTTLSTETVDVFGGSMAHGWLDPHSDSYVKRAFSARSMSTDTNYKYVDHTIVGETPVRMQESGKFQLWLKKDRPQIVVLAWGLLNSIASKHKTTVTQFGDAIRDEIADALKAHAVVLIVTPPVVQASATVEHAKQEVFIRKLFSVADSFNNRNVVILDVYHQMEVYIQAHHQTYRMYYGNIWHPNQAGHELAGTLLENDLVLKFGLGAIQFHS